LGEHAFFHRQLRARRVPHCPMPLVDAAPVGAQQAAQHLHRLGCFQAQHRLELRTQRPVREIFQQRGSRARLPAGPGQHPAQVLDQVGAGPGAFLLLRQRHRLLRGAAQLELAQRLAGYVCAARARVCMAADGVPHRRRDLRQGNADSLGELIRPARVQLREVQRAALRRAGREVGRLRQLRQLPLRRRAAILVLEPRCTGAQVGGDGLAPGGEQAHHLAGDALDLEPVAVVARDPLHAEPAGQRLL
jgi:hypothetical protein